jgi:trk system potassium uptake protein TrkA
MNVKSRRAIIVGGGRVGRRTAVQLADNGYMVTIIEHDADKEAMIPEHPVGRVIVGDGADVDVFERANPTTADIVAGLTNDTDTNLAVSELASELVPGIRTLVRISRDGEQSYAHLEHVDNVVYPAAAGATVATGQIVGETTHVMPPEFSYTGRRND